MKKVIYIFLGFLIFLSLFQTHIPQANAAINCELADDAAKDSSGWSPPSTKSTKITFPLSYDPSFADMPKEVEGFIKYEIFDPVRILISFPTGDGASLSVNRDNHTIKIEEIRSQGNNGGSFYIGAPVDITAGKWRAGNYRLIIVPKGKNINEQYCSVEFTVKPYCVIDINGGPSDWVPGWKPSFKVTEFNPYGGSGNPLTQPHIALLLKDGVVVDGPPPSTAKKMYEDGISFLSDASEGNYQITVHNKDNAFDKCESNYFNIKAGGGSEGCTDNSQCTANPDAVCLPAGADGVRACGISSDYLPGKIPLACKEGKDAEGNGNGKFKCQTAIGEISANPDDFATSILTLLLSLAGTILIVLLIINGYKLMTSQGDPEKIKDAREGIIAAIAGVLLIIFSLSILRLITVDILGIPGFS